MADSIQLTWKLAQTTVVDGTLNGHELGRRSLKKWDERRWFIDLPQPLCGRAKVDTGSRIQLVLQIATDKLPAELEELLATNPAAKQACDRLFNRVPTNVARKSGGG